MIGNRPCLSALSAQGIHRRTLRPADGEGHPRRTGEARPRPAPGVQDRRLPGRRRSPEGPAARHACWKAWSPTSPTSAPSSISACIRTAWCTSRRWRTASSRTRTSVVKAGDVVKVKVLEVDLGRKRIALTMRLSEGAVPPTGKEKSGQSAGGKPPSPKPPSGKKQPSAPAPMTTMADAFARFKERKP
ncbi:MAG: S1 RNA-binding domain-containing protein [Candidatus Manganitrophus sp.]|nr:MAG: S1 RNA-binding domain-containing protein [Candidatus Manganitrophus sp.]